MKLENKFRHQLQINLKRYFGASVYIQKNHGSNFSSGLPDLYIAQADAGNVHLELKAVEKYAMFDWADQPTPLQRHTLRTIYDAGDKVGVLIYFHAERTLHAFHGKLLMEIFEMVRPASGFLPSGPGFEWDPRGDLRLMRMDSNHEHQYITWNGGPSDVLDLARVVWGLPPDVKAKELRRAIRGARPLGDA